MGSGAFRAAVAGPPALPAAQREALFAVPPDHMSQFVGAASWDPNDPRQPLAAALVRAAENAAQVVQDTRKEATAVHDGLGQIQAGIRRILDLITRLPRGGGNVELHEQTIRYLMTLLERLRTVVPEAQQGPIRTQDYQNVLDELRDAEQKLQRESEQGGQGGRKSTTGGRRKRRRKRGGFMYSPAARKASVARLKSRKASVRTHRRKRHKRTVRRRYKKSRRRQRRKRRRRGGRTTRRRRR